MLACIRISSRSRPCYQRGEVFTQLETGRRKLLDGSPFAPGMHTHNSSPGCLAGAPPAETASIKGSFPFSFPLVLLRESCSLFLCFPFRDFTGWLFVMAAELGIQPLCLQIPGTSLYPVSTAKCQQSKSTTVLRLANWLTHSDSSD